MAFTPKDWQDEPSHVSPITAAALKDLEQRLADYAESVAGGDSDAVVKHPTDGDTNAIHGVLDENSDALPMIKFLLASGWANNNAEGQVIEIIEPDGVISPEGNAVKLTAYGLTVQNDAVSVYSRINQGLIRARGPSGVVDISGGFAADEVAYMVRVRGVGFANVFTVNNYGEVTHKGHTVLSPPATEPPTPPADSCTTYVRDNAGKTELVAKFDDGSVVPIAVQP